MFVTTGGAGYPASKLCPFGGQPSRPAAENGALLGSRLAAAPAVGGFGSAGSSGTMSGSTGSAGAGFGSTGSAGAVVGSTGGAGAGFGSTGGAGAGFGSTGSAGAVFGSTGSAGPGFGSTGGAGAGFGSTSGGGSGQFSFSFKPTVTSTTTTSSLPPPVTSAVPAGWCSSVTYTSSPLSVSLVVSCFTSHCYQYSDPFGPRAAAALSLQNPM